jgi:hypothetical protein
MASFCTKCGAGIPPDSQFCTACGAPAATGGVVGAPIPPANYVQPYAPMSAPAKSGSNAVKIILIVVGVFVGLGVLGVCIFAFTVWRVTRGVHVETHGVKVTVQGPGGSISTDTSASYTPEELGTDMYPGASTGKGGKKMDLGNTSMITAVFFTPDSKDKVVSFYKSKMSGEKAVMETPEAAILTLKKDEKDSVMVTITAKPSENDGKTQITIVHTREKGAS